MRQEVTSVHKPHPCLTKHHLLTGPYLCKGKHPSKYTLNYMDKTTVKGQPLPKMSSSLFSLLMTWGGSLLLLDSLIVHRNLCYTLCHWHLQCIILEVYQEQTLITKGRCIWTFCFPIANLMTAGWYSHRPLDFCLSKKIVCLPLEVYGI